MKVRKEVNPFDILDSGIEFDQKQAEKERQKMEAEYNKRDYMIHKVFSQTQEGVDLLNYWMEKCIINTPVIRRGDSHDLIEIGINQGIQEFVRSIYLTCQKIDAKE